MIALLFRTVLVIHIELLLCSYCPKDFCPGLETPLFAKSIPHVHISCNTPCLHPPPPNFSFLHSVTVVLREIRDNAYTECLGANKVYYGRCANGDWNPVPFVRSSCYCGCNLRSGVFFFLLLFVSLAGDRKKITPDAFI